MGLRRSAYLRPGRTPQEVHQIWSSQEVCHTRIKHYHLDVHGAAAAAHLYTPKLAAARATALQLLDTIVGG